LLKELKEHIGIEFKPTEESHYYWEQGLPFYEVGHHKKVQEIETKAPS